MREATPATFQDEATDNSTDRYEPTDFTKEPPKGFTSWRSFNARMIAYELNANKITGKVIKGIHGWSDERIIKWLNELPGTLLDEGHTFTYYYE